MKDLSVGTELFGYEISAAAKKAGPDWLVTVTGGCLPHIGSTTIAEYKDGSAQMYTILREGHRDNVVGEMFAQEICLRTKETVCVSCGIHYDDVSKEEILQIVAASGELLNRLLEEIGSAR